MKRICTEPWLSTKELTEENQFLRPGEKDVAHIVYEAETHDTSVLQDLSLLDITEDDEEKYTPSITVSADGLILESRASANRAKALKQQQQKKAEEEANKTALRMQAKEAKNAKAKEALAKREAANKAKDAKANEAEATKQEAAIKAKLDKEAAIKSKLDKQVIKKVQQAKAKAVSVSSKGNSNPAILSSRKQTATPSATIGGTKRSAGSALEDTFGESFDALSSVSPITSPAPVTACSQLNAQQKREQELTELRAKIAHEKEMRRLQAELESIEAAPKKDKQSKGPVNSKNTETPSATKRKRDTTPSTNDSSPSNSSSSEEKEGEEPKSEKKRRKSKSPPHVLSSDDYKRRRRGHKKNRRKCNYQSKKNVCTAIDESFSAMNSENLLLHQSEERDQLERQQLFAKHQRERSNFAHSVERKSLLRSRDHL